MLESMRAMDLVQQYIVGEPLVVCPRELENVYPAASYEFPPERLTVQGRRTFIVRLSRFLRTHQEAHDHFVLFAPRHHSDILKEAAFDTIDVVYIPYNIYNLPKLRKALAELDD